MVLFSLCLCLCGKTKHSGKVGLDFGQMIFGLELVSCPGFQGKTREGHGFFFLTEAARYELLEARTPSDLLKPPQNFKARTNEPRNGDLWRLSLAFRGNNHFMSFQRNHEFPSSSFVEQGSSFTFFGGVMPQRVALPFQLRPGRWYLPVCRRAGCDQCRAHVGCCLNRLRSG